MGESRDYVFGDLNISKIQFLFNLQHRYPVVPMIHVLTNKLRLQNMQIELQHNNATISVSALWMLRTGV